MSWGVCRVLTLPSSLLHVFQMPKHFKIPDEMAECLGTACGFDLHVDELKMDEIDLLSKPIPILRYACFQYKCTESLRLFNIWAMCTGSRVT